MTESRKRSGLKSITWPIVHAGFVSILVYFFERLITGQAHWEYAGAFALIYTTCEAIGFYLHERIWSRFGSKIR
ncbi:MAG: DUF2061 domain-containing protein [Actinobacteria bacterium]|nr:DUF2061 domain-containing protein [Actinomycetota bacterium]